MPPDRGDHLERAVTTPIKAIETSYAGCRFRSRLEARWAVFLNHLGIRWEYEAQGYQLPSGNRYLPDFWLPELQLHVEVKGSEEDFRKEGARYAEAVLSGALPGHGLLILGPVPDLAAGVPQHFVLTTDEHCCGKRALCLHIALAEWLLDRELVGSEAHLACTDLMSHQTDLPALRGYGHGKAKYTNCGPMPPDWPMSQEVMDAYIAARSARFEHGERGR